MSPDDILFVDIDGTFVGLEEVITDGLSRDYSERHPALRRMLREGDPRHRFYACLMLAAWGVRDGLMAVIDWAGNPGSVPWAGEPVTYDRFFGVDDSFARMAAALETARDIELSATAAALRRAAARSLLLIYDQVYFDRSLYVLLDIDVEIAAATRPETEWAVAVAISAARDRADYLTYDMATQAAFLVGPLAEFDDDAAASAAENVMSLAPGWDRTLRELGLALSRGRGPATHGVLQRLAASSIAGVRTEAQKSLDRRGAPTDVARPSGVGDDLAAIDVPLIRSWSRKLCRLMFNSPTATADALGLGDLVTDEFGQILTQSPPPDATQVRLGLRKGAVDYVEITLSGRGMTRGHLDANLGVGREMPQVHPGTPRQVAYPQVSVIGAPFTCTIFAHFTDEPTPVAAVETLMLRRDRAAVTNTIRDTAPEHETDPSARFFFVGDLPVLLVPQPGNGSELGAIARALHLRTGAFIEVDVNPLREADAEEVEATAFYRVVGELRRAGSHERQVAPLRWVHTGDPERPYRAELGGDSYWLRENDFPLEPAYSLIVDDQVVDHLDNWPDTWSKVDHANEPDDGKEHPTAPT